MRTHRSQWLLSMLMQANGYLATGTETVVSRGSFLLLSLAESVMGVSDPVRTRFHVGFL